MTYPTLTRQQLADLRGVKAQTVSKQRLPKDRDGRYDLKNKDVRDWFMQPFKTEWENAHRRKQKDLPEGDGTLNDEKTKADIILKEKQGRKLDLQYDIEKKDLQHTSMVGLFLGHFATGIKTNFLTIGNKVARGDTELRDRIEKLIKIAIEKTIEGAEMGLEQDGIKLLDPKEIIGGE